MRIAMTSQDASKSKICSNLENSGVSFLEWLDAPVRPGIFVSRTREKLGRTCDQIGRTLEPWFSNVVMTDWIQYMHAWAYAC